MQHQRSNNAFRPAFATRRARPTLTSEVGLSRNMCRLMYRVQLRSRLSPSLPPNDLSSAYWVSNGDYRLIDFDSIHPRSICCAGIPQTYHSASFTSRQLYARVTRLASTRSVIPKQRSRLRVANCAAAAVRLAPSFACDRDPANLVRKCVERDIVVLRRRKIPCACAHVSRLRNSRNRAVACAVDSDQPSRSSPMFHRATVSPAFACWVLSYP